MLQLISDNDVQGHVERLMDICQAPPWDEFWHYLDCRFCTFDELGLPTDASDATVWQVCQDNGLVLITGNRNSEGPESLETTIRYRNGPEHLPVLTLADIDRVGRDRHYVESIVERLFDILINIELLRGTGRLFLP